MMCLLMVIIYKDYSLHTVYNSESVYCGTAILEYLVLPWAKNV